MTTDDDSREITRCTKPPLTAFVAVVLLIIGLCLMLGGCAATTLYGDDGQPLARIQSNAIGLRYTKHGQDITLTADTINNSTPTAAAYRGINHTVGAVALGVAPFVGGASTATTITPALVQGAALFRPQTRP